VFPQSFKATVRERMAIWSAVLLFLAVIFATVQMIHVSRLGLVASEMAGLADVIPADQAAAAKKLKALRGQLDWHMHSNERNVTLLSMLLAFAILLIGTLEYRWLIRPIARMSHDLSKDRAPLQAMETVAMRRDDLGVLGRALLAQRRNADERETSARQTIDERDATLAAQADFQQANIAFRTSVSNIVEALNGHARRMATASRDLTETARSAEQRSLSVSEATGHASSHVTGIAAAFEAMAHSLNAVSSETSATADAAGAARTLVLAAHQDTALLKEAVGMIGQMVRLIGDVASKTNLLALNATIEAARVGEQGKGFAVVAQEVKQLAQQTAQATGDASARLEAITSAATRITDRVQALVQSVESVDRASLNISSLMREQDEKSREVQHNAATTAHSMQDIAQQVEQVAGLMAETSNYAGLVSTVSSDLTQQADRLDAAMDDFLKATQRIAA
jgi:methyl-accepting chemotaxis protein